MRSYYPVSSQEINDKLQIAHEMLAHLLGSETNTSGVYDRLQASGISYIVSTSGIPIVADTDDFSATAPFFYKTSELCYRAGLQNSIPKKWGK